MTSPDFRPHSVPSLRLSSLGRRVTASPSLSAAIVDLAYGAAKRDHVEAVHLATASRVSAFAEQRADDLAGKVIVWASRAHRARARLAPDDAEAAAAVGAWCRRRLKLDARRVLGRDVPDSVRADVAELCVMALGDRLQALDAARTADEASK